MIRAKTIIEMMGAPKEHIEEVMKKYLKDLPENTGVKVLSKEVSEAECIVVGFDPEVIIDPPTAVFSETVTCTIILYKEGDEYKVKTCGVDGAGEIHVQNGTKVIFTCMEKIEGGDDEQIQNFCILFPKDNSPFEKDN